MINLLENGNFAIITTIICVFSSLLWPILISPKSRLHIYGIIIHSAILLYLLLLIFDGMNILGIEYIIHLPALNGFTLVLKTSKIGLLFAMLIVLLWPAAYLYSIGFLSMTQDKSISRFLLFLNLSVVCGVVLSLAGDLLTMFIMYECLTLSTLPLVGHNYSVHVNKAVKKYIIYLFFGSICLWLPSILYIKSFTGDLEFMKNGIFAINPIKEEYLIVIFIFTVMGVAKAAIFPMHSWLPSAMAANYPTSALLHAVLVVNSGIYCLYKIMSEIFGNEIIYELLIHNLWVYYILLFGVFYSGLKAILQRTIKKILAWSTVSQLNIIFLVMISPGAPFKNLAMTNLVYHSFCKISLFFCAGAIYSCNYATYLEEFRNSYKRYKWEFCCFILACSLLTGLPILGFDEYKRITLTLAEEYNNNILMLAIIISSVFSLIYFGKIIMEMSVTDSEIFELEQKHNHPNIYVRLSTSYCMILSLLMFKYYSEIYNYMQNF